MCTAQIAFAGPIPCVLFARNLQLSQRFASEGVKVKSGKKVRTALQSIRNSCLVAHKTLEINRSLGNKNGIVPGYR